MLIRTKLITLKLNCDFSYSLLLMDNELSINFHSTNKRRIITIAHSMFVLNCSLLLNELIQDPSMSAFTCYEHVESLYHLHLEEHVSRMRRGGYQNLEYNMNLIPY